MGLKGLTLGLQYKISKTVCLLSRALNDTTQALDILSQELNEVREGLLENHATLDCLLLLYHLGFGKFPHMCSFNITVNSCKVS